MAPSKYLSPLLLRLRQLLGTLMRQPMALSRYLRLEREIKFLREYRTRLVADVVTGKLDVREAAARLPELEPESGAELDNVEADETEEDLTEVDA
ncbi:MAG: hypothetical protein IPK39_02535 [Sulfuritalea sp.]|nr:hypothetical protein [Sulfuritalea sp.]